MPVLIAALFLALGAPSADVSKEVREHLKAGQLHYSLGEFADAAKEFRQAFRLKQDPGLLFNIAQCERQLHEYQQAYFHYRQYLNARADAPNKTEVESLIEQMRYKMDEEAEQKTRIARDPAAAKNSESTLPVAPAESVAPARAPAPAAGTSRLRITGYAALGAGALGEGLAFVFHNSAKSAADQFNSKYAAGTLTGADAQLKSDAESKGKLATAALIGGAALLVTGAVLCLAF
jgi:tetratricopeptide (TPR) repeat protein